MSLVFAWMPRPRPFVSIGSAAGPPGPPGEPLPLPVEVVALFVVSLGRDWFPCPVVSMNATALYLLRRPC